MMNKEVHAAIIAKAIILSIALAFLGASCSNPSQESDLQSESEYEFTTESAEKAIHIAESLQRELPVTDADWEELFKSSGYEHYLIYSDSIEKKRLIRNALEIVFLPAHSNQLDSLLNIPLIMDKDYFKLSLVHNFNHLKDNFDNAKTFLESTDFKRLIAAGDSLAKTYLPKRVQDSLPQLYNIHLILSDPDAKVMEDAIVFDLNMALSKGKNELIEIIAHEFHHNYRELTAESYDHPLINQLTKIHQEGVADLIDKDTPPIEQMSLYPVSVIEMYNSDFTSTPLKLKNLDSLTLAFLNDDIDSITYHERLENYFAFGGHTNGLYMSLTIVENKGMQVLVDSFDDPIEFIRIYNEVAQASPTEYAFSSEFMDYLARIE